MIVQLYENFRHWSSTGSVWTFSDPHFEDEDCRLMDPNWISPEEQVEIINKMVFKTDTFICLGDCGELKYFDQLKSQYRILIRGNHDDKSRKLYAEHFDEIFDGAVFVGPKILLSHEPINLPFCLNIHGHDHSGMEHYETGCKHLNVAANVCDYTPVNLGKLIKQGILSDIPNIHRMTIDNAIAKKQRKERWLNAENDKTWEKADC